MSNKVCDVSNVIKVLGTSVYKTLISDNVPNKVVRIFTSNLLREDGLVFAASDLGYTIRTLARECMGEYVTSFYGYTQYIGGALNTRLEG